MRSRSIKHRFLINRGDRSPEEQFFSLRCFIVFRVYCAAEEGPRWGVSQIFRNLETQTLLTHEQRLKLNYDGRPSPKEALKNRTPESVSGSFSWIYGEEERSAYFC